MQNKGIIKFFAIALAVVCLFQLSFTFFASRTESKAKKFAESSQEILKIAKEKAKGDASMELYYKDSLYKVKENYFLDSVQNQVIFNILVRKYTFKECKERSVNLGLDLKGGMNVTLEVSIPDLLRELSGKSNDVTFNKAMNMAIQKQKTSQKEFLTLFYESFKEADPNAKLAGIFSTVELKDRVKFNTSNDDVMKVISEEVNGAIDRTFNILRTRIDKFGVTQPNITKLSQSGRILVELPGVKDPDRVRKLLQGTAKLEFWETYEYKDLYSFFSEANKKLSSILSTEINTGADTLNMVQDSLLADNKEADAKKDTSGLLNEIGGDTTQKEGGKGGKQSFAEYAKENPLFAYLNPAMSQDKSGNYFPNRGPVVGYALLKDLKKVDLMLEKVKKMFPQDVKFSWTNKPVEDKSDVYQLVALKVTTRDGSAPLEGDAIVDARQDFGQNNTNEISMTMNSDGARIWKRLTADNIGKSIAIVLDNTVYSFPTVQNEIPNGRSSITGRFSLEEAKDLALVLKVGKLPAPARIVQEEVVGPSLGKEAINAGLLSFLIAFLLVLIYMGLYYNRAGMIADLALVTNIFFLMGVLASLGAVLTLPGIAGIVLTLGMAVDANVIIYERIKEEVRHGKGMRLALSDGYKNAYSAIIDGNVTTIITGIVLYIFGSGPVQGFATTLIIGILTSLFSAIFISRIIFEWMLSRNMNLVFDNRHTRNFLTNTKIDFIGIRKKLYIVSGVIIVIGIFSLVFKGLNYGVDFTGGRTYIVRFDRSVKTNEVRDLLYKEFREASEVKTFGSDNQVKITTKYMINDNVSNVDSIIQVKLFNALKSVYKKNINQVQFSTADETIGLLSSQKIGPTIAKDIRNAAIMAVFFALIAIFVYIAIRFKKWQFGLGGVISLFHDTLIVISMYSIFSGIFPFSMEVDQAFIAAVLTIIGYSINDSVIIFDRIREYTVLYPKRELKMNMNDAMNSTLGRTLNTAGTTLVVLIAIFLFGGDVIRGFVFALLVGIGIGTYSSIFNATPVAYDFIMWRNKRKAMKKETSVKQK